MLTATLSQRPPDPITASSNPASAGVAVTLSLLLLAFWVVMHRYAGMDHDARVYAFQALSRLHPYLRSDLYLQNTSQDQFTIFSPFYAFFIGLMGLENSALLLTVIFTLWFMAAACAIARQLDSHALAWFSVAAVIVISGDYGAFGVFHFPGELSQRPIAGPMRSWRRRSPSTWATTSGSASWLVQWRCRSIPSWRFLVYSCFSASVFPSPSASWALLRESWEP